KRTIAAEKEQKEPKKIGCSKMDSALSIFTPSKVRRSSAGSTRNGFGVWNTSRRKSLVKKDPVRGSNTESATETSTTIFNAFTNSIIAELPYMKARASV